MSAKTLSCNIRDAKCDRKCPQVSIIDLEAEKPKRLRTLVHVNENAEVVVTGSKYVDVDFSKDSKLVVAVTNEPTYTIIVWDWFRTRRVGSYDVRTMINRVCFNPFDTGQLSTSGAEHFRLWKVQENILKAYPTFQGVTPGTFITDHTWTNDDRLVAVTDAASVLIIDEGVVVQTIEKTHSKPGGFTSVCSCARGLIASGVDGRIVLVDMVALKENLMVGYLFDSLQASRVSKNMDLWIFYRPQYLQKKMSLHSCLRIILPRLLWVMHI